jgi:hypothetical protein
MSWRALLLETCWDEVFRTPGPTACQRAWVVQSSKVQRHTLHNLTSQLPGRPEGSVYWLCCFYVLKYMHGLATSFDPQCEVYTRPEVCTWPGRCAHAGSCNTLHVFTWLPSIAIVNSPLQ